MSDIIDIANDYMQRDLDVALSFRKPVSTRCEECGQPATVLPNGARARYCADCLPEMTGNG